MKKIKRILLFIPVFIMIFVNLSIPAFAESEGNNYIFSSYYPTISDIKDYYYNFLTIYNKPIFDYYDSMNYFVLQRDYHESNFVVYQYVFVPDSVDTIYWNQRNSCFFMTSCPGYIGRLNIQYNTYVSDRYACSYDYNAGYGNTNFNIGQVFYFDTPGELYATNMNVLDWDGNSIYEPEPSFDFDISITYDSDNQEISFYMDNQSSDSYYDMTCGVHEYQNFSAATVGPGMDYRRLLSVEPLINFATDRGDDYSDYIAYINVSDQNGNLLDTLSVNVGDLISGVSEDMFDDKKEYLPFPDPDDYFSNPPEFPDLTPFPDFPGFDPEHPWQSLFEILRWLGQCILVPFQNLFKIIRWLAETLCYYLIQGWHYLQDCFIVIVKNIGIALYNLAVDIKKLLIRLFVPKNLEFEQKLKQKFPIFWSIKHLVNNLSVTGNESITVSLPSFDSHIGNHTMTISAVDSLGQSGCNTLFNLSRVIIAAFCLFSMINIVSSVFNMSLHSTVKED